MLLLFADMSYSFFLFLPSFLFFFVTDWGGGGDEGGGGDREVRGCKIMWGKGGNLTGGKCNR